MDKKEFFVHYSARFWIKKCIFAVGEQNDERYEDSYNESEEGA